MQREISTRFSRGKSVAAELATPAPSYCKYHSRSQFINYTNQEKGKGGERDSIGLNLDRNRGIYCV